MKKVLKVEDLDCAHCAAKLEDAINGIDGVEKATVSFMAQKIVMELDEAKADSIVKEIKKTAKKLVPDCTILA